jgi:hypothetical protein
MEAEHPHISGAAMYEHLRSMALDAVALGIEPPEEHPSVAGVVVDIPTGEDEYATLVVMGDGSTSLYTSTGGGTIGAGAHEQVREAATDLLELVDVNVAIFPATEATDQPPPGRVRWFVLTPDGRRVADMEDDVFWGRIRHPSTPLAAAAQQVIAALREATPPDS